MKRALASVGILAWAVWASLAWVPEPEARAQFFNDRAADDPTINILPLTPSAQSGYFYELRSDNSVTYDVSTTNVRYWGDISGNARDFQQATIANQCTLLAAGTADANGVVFSASKPVVQCIRTTAGGGSGKFMQVVSSLTMATTSASVYLVGGWDEAQTVTTFNLLKGAGSNVGAHNAWSVAQAGSQDCGIPGQINTTLQTFLGQEFNVSTGLQQEYSVCSTQDIDPRKRLGVVAVTFDRTVGDGGQGVVCYYNGQATKIAVTLFSNAMGSNTWDSNNQYVVGLNSSSNFYATYAHIIVYSSLHSAATVAGVTQYLRDYWGTP